MPTPQTIVLFMISALALNVTPGPTILFLLSRCMREGRSAAVVSAFGLATASIVQAIAAALGLSALFIYSPLAFAIIKYCGAAYLVYLGVRGFLSGGIAGLATKTESASRPSLTKLFLQGLLTDLLNPKLIVFFFSFLPQFVDPARGDPRAQMLVLGLLFQVTGLPVNLAVALAGSALTTFIAGNPFWSSVQRWGASVVLVGLGVRLAFSERR
jgi:threonine/homoserine/homoserine lactone efflux protein